MNKKKGYGPDNPATIVLGTSDVEVICTEDVPGEGEDGLPLTRATEPLRGLEVIPPGSLGEGVRGAPFATPDEFRTQVVPDGEQPTRVALRQTVVAFGHQPPVPPVEDDRYDLDAPLRVEAPVRPASPPPRAEDEVVYPKNLDRPSGESEEPTVPEVPRPRRVSSRPSSPPPFPPPGGEELPPVVPQPLGEGELVGGDEPPPMPTSTMGPRTQPSGVNEREMGTSKVRMSTDELQALQRSDSTPALPPEPAGGDPWGHAPSEPNFAAPAAWSEPMSRSVSFGSDHGVDPHGGTLLSTADLGAAATPTPPTVVVKGFPTWLGVILTIAVVLLAGRIVLDKYPGLLSRWQGVPASPPPTVVSKHCFETCRGKKATALIKCAKENDGGGVSWQVCLRQVREEQQKN